MDEISIAEAVVRHLALRAGHRESNAKGILSSGGLIQVSHPIRDTNRNHHQYFTGSALDVIAHTITEDQYLLHEGELLEGIYSLKTADFKLLKSGDMADGLEGKLLATSTVNGVVSLQIPSIDRNPNLDYLRTKRDFTVAMRDRFELQDVDSTVAYLFHQ